MNQNYFYDEQIRRFLLQFARIFSNFQIEYGRDNSGNATLIRVPVRYGDSSRQAQTILQENSASSLPSTPLMTFYITGLDYDRPRIQEPYHVNKMQVRQRFYDQDTDTYETAQGNAFTIERLMPVPYKMTINLDIWTSNTNQKWQLFEQIATLFNPALEIQSTDNFIDWTSLSVVELDRNSYTSRTIPVGTENPIDIMTMTFTIPIWISSPAKVKKLGVIEKIIMSVYDSQGDANEAILNSDLLLGTRQKFTPYGYQTLLIGNKVQALKYSQTINTPNGSVTPPESPPSNEFWHTIIGMYGGVEVLRPGITQMRFDNPWGDETEIIGTVTYDPTDDRFLLIDIDTDTIPQNTLSPVDAIIDPLASGPGAGLPAPTAGTRYLILSDMGPDTISWGAGINAQANDIIEYDGTQWTVAWSATDNGDTLQFVTNIITTIQYRWVGDSWVKSYEGLYPGGEWSIVL
jgi:hypothetical protein